MAVYVEIKKYLVLERSRNDIEDQVNVTSTSLSDHAFWTPSAFFIIYTLQYARFLQPYRKDRSYS